MANYAQALSTVAKQHFYGPEITVVSSDQLLRAVSEALETTYANFEAVAPGHWVALGDEDFERQLDAFTQQVGLRLEAIFLSDLVLQATSRDTERYQPFTALVEDYLNERELPV
jgi:hypothetical protein